MPVTGKRVAILVEDLYQELEVWYPFFRLKEAGADVLVVGTNKKEFKSKLGYPILADVIVERVSVNQFDALIIPGGYAPDILRRYDFVNNLVADIFKQGKLVASICHGPWVMCSAGILKGKKATCFFAIKDDVVNAGAKYSDAEVVVDGDLVTSRCPDDLPAFMRESIKILKAQKPVQSVKVN
jgi:protease I